MTWSKEIIEPVILSLRVASLATTLVFLAGLAAARFMALRDFPAKDALEAVLSLPLVLPPSVIGFGLLMLFGQQGPLGKLLEETFGVSVVFTWWAAVLASAVVAFPLFYRTVRAALEAVDKKIEDAARTLGAGELRVFLTVSLPLAWPGLLAGTVMAFARGLGEFGATMMLAGNIPGQTQTIALAVYAASESGETHTAAILVGLMIVVSFTVIYGTNALSKRNLRRWASPAPEPSFPEDTQAPPRVFPGGRFPPGQ